MSPISNELEMTELVIKERQAADMIHEYAFGIISSDTKGLATVVSISTLAPNTKGANNTSSPDEDFLNSIGFQSWSMSRYQSLYHSTSFHEEVEEEQGDTDNDSNNNYTVSATNTNPIHSESDHRRPSLKSSRSSGCLRSSSSNGSAKQSSFTRRWSTNSFFGSKLQHQQPPRCLPIDPDMPPLSLPEEAESWLSAITHIPDKIRQHRADKTRFNVKAVPREQLQHLYCY